MAIDSGSTIDGLGDESTLAVPHLELYEERSDACRTLVLIGELDMASAPALDAAVRRVCADGTEQVALDLSKLTFMDSTGLRVMLVAKDLCELHGCEFQLVPGPAQVQRLFEVTGLLEQLPFRA
jgi:anti-sigma B factor antagonist